MSTIVVVRKGDRACIGADTLTSFGGTRESAKYVANHSKIQKVGSAYIAKVGSPVVEMALIDYVDRRKKKPSLNDSQSIFRFFNEFHKSLKDDYHLNQDDEDESFENSPMSALVLNANGVFGVYRERTVFEYTRFYAFGSGYEIALGAMHACYDRYKEPEKIAEAGLKAATEFDKGSSEPIEIFSRKLRSPKKAAAKSKKK